MKVAMKTAGLEANMDDSAELHLGAGEVGVFKGKRFSPERGKDLYHHFSDSSNHVLTLGTNPEGRQRVSCLTTKVTLPPFFPGSRWTSRRCSDCHRVNLESDRN